MELQNLTDAEREDILRRFDSFSKKVIRNEVANQMKRIERDRKKRDRELSYEELITCIAGAAWDEYAIEKDRIELRGKEYLFEDEALYEAVNSLSNSLKTVLLLTCYDEKTAEETAKELAIQIGTVYRYRSLAMKCIREKLCEK